MSGERPAGRGNHRNAASRGSIPTGDASSKSDCEWDASKIQRTERETSAADSGRYMEWSQSGRCVDAAYCKRIVCGRDESKPHGKYSASEMTQKNNSSGAKRTANIRVGPAGWSYPDWSGYAYPSRKARGFNEVSYLAEFFDTIEINTSFYNPIRVDHAKLWVQRAAANPNFMFTAKMWQRFTHDPSPGSEDEGLVRAGFDVLRDAHKLAAVLLQFPFSFHRNKETLTYLAKLLRRFADYPLVVEVRHATWNAPEVFVLLREAGAGFCNIDQPVIGRSIEPTAEATGAVGYVRLHGRRYDTWFNDEPSIPGYERYNYLYSEEELRPWADRTEKVAEAARDVYVITNNHYQGKGVVNALQLISMLKQSKVKVPEPLRLKYPELEKIASEGPREPTLFEIGKSEKKK